MMLVSGTIHTHLKCTYKRLRLVSWKTASSCSVTPPPFSAYQEKASASSPASPCFPLLVLWHFPRFSLPAARKDFGSACKIQAQPLTVDQAWSLRGY